MTDPLDRRVDELELSVRSAVGLANLGIETLRELVRHSESDLLKSKNFGRRSLLEIKEILGDLGLTLGRTDDPVPDDAEDDEDFSVL